MKNLIKNSTEGNAKFSQFTATKLSKAAQQKVKGGEDVIIVEEIIMQ